MVTTANQIKARLSAAVEQVMAACAEEERKNYALCRKADRRARKRPIADGVHWTESYPLTIDRSYGLGGRAEATIKIEGAPTYIEVVEQPRFMKDARPVYKMWVRAFDPHTDDTFVADLYNLESAIQRGVVMAIGAAYYDDPSTTEEPAKRRGVKRVRD